MKNENVNIGLRLLKKNEVEEALEFQRDVFNEMSCKEWFYLTTKDKFLEAIEGRGKVGFLMDNDKKMGVFYIFL